MESFKVLDSNKEGTIPVIQLQYYLNKYGVQMNEMEVEEILKEIGSSEGIVNYRNFVNYLLD